MSFSPIELTWARTLKIWWAIFWRGLLLGGLVGGILGFIAGISIVLFKLPWNPEFVGGLLGQLAAIPISMLVLHWVLGKRFKEFSIRLIPNEMIAQSDEFIETGDTTNGCQG